MKKKKTSHDVWERLSASLKKMRPTASVRDVLIVNCNLRRIPPASVLPTTLHGLAYLKTFDLSDNALGSIPSGAVCPIKETLLHLNLAGNRFSRLEDSGVVGNKTECNLDHLITLQLSGNRLQELPYKSFKMAGHDLRTLKLDHNQVNTVTEDAFEGLDKLRLLDLSYNRLNLLSEVLNSGHFRGLDNLLLLNLSYNALGSSRVFGSGDSLGGGGWVIGAGGGGSGGASSGGAQGGAVGGGGWIMGAGQGSYNGQGVGHGQGSSGGSGQGGGFGSGQGSYGGHGQGGRFGDGHGGHGQGGGFGGGQGVGGGQGGGYGHGSYGGGQGAAGGYYGQGGFVSGSGEFSFSAFDHLHHLSTLDLSHNHIQTIQLNGVFRQLPNLVTLILSGNNMHTVSAGAFYGLNHLNTLVMSHNQLKILPRDCFGYAPRLQELELDYNLFESISELRALNELRTLNYNHNRIRSLKRENFLHMPNLRGLKLSHNLLTVLRNDTFTAVPKLKMLNLSHNQIASIHQSTFELLVKLMYLRLDSNKLDEINGLLTTQHHLQWLNVSSNQLLWFDYAFIPKSLEYLDLSNNRVEEIGNFYDMQTGYHLKTLDASNNHLQKLDRLGLQGSLEEVNFQNNAINQIAPNTFSDLNNLTNADLSNNQISKMAINSMALKLNAGKSATLRLANNPLVCDCDMEWLQRINDLSQSSPRQYPQVLDLENLSCTLINKHSKPGDGNEKPLVPLLSVRPDQFICEYDVHCFALCLCCEFFACDCRMRCSEGCSCYHDQTWSDNIINCGNRNHSKVPDMIPMDATSIYLDGNPQLTDISGDTFIGRKHLTSLYLNNSGITEINLEILTLHGNKLNTLAVGNIIPADASAQAGIQQLSMTGNPWTCSCDFVQDVQQVLKEHRDRIVDVDKLECETEGEIVNIGKYNVTCADVMAVRSVDGLVIGLIPLIIIAFLFMLALLTLCCLALCCRNQLYAWMNSKYGFRLTGPIDAHDKERKYDAYIHYAPSDDQFTRQLLTRNLDEYRLCLRHRDIDEKSASALASAAKSSGRVVLLGTPAYLADKAAQSEMATVVDAVAPRKRPDQILVILKEDVLGAGMSGGGPRRQEELKRKLQESSLLKDATFMTWGSESFWNRFRYNLPEHPLDADINKKNQQFSNISSHTNGVKTTTSTLSPASNPFLDEEDSKTATNVSNTYTSSLAAPTLGTAATAAAHRSSSTTLSRNIENISSSHHQSSHVVNNSSASTMRINEKSSHNEDYDDMWTYLKGGGTTNVQGSGGSSLSTRSTTDGMAENTGVILTTNNVSNNAYSGSSQTNRTSASNRFVNLSSSSAGLPPSHAAATASSSAINNNNTLSSNAGAMILRDGGQYGTIGSGGGLEGGGHTTTTTTTTTVIKRHIVENPFDNFLDLPPNSSSTKHLLPHSHLSDSDYMSVSEPIYHTLDARGRLIEEGCSKVKKQSTVYMDNDLKVVYPSKVGGGNGGGSGIISSSGLSSSGLIGSITNAAGEGNDDEEERLLGGSLSRSSNNHHQRSTTTRFGGTSDYDKFRTTDRHDSSATNERGFGNGGTSTTSTTYRTRNDSYYI
ncbi:unnamed protein product [Lepeophtheirus salmonis]|uniref:(salmon louse) hypothetical protein n=1 Tax=Lepeophtheirus salmonis TaxID=72036 RepID=A0A7R8CFW7_LEPSM|nr:unnamed protein product [Lepeophtheirus salmonis]CAF2810378.1 unnamed protein product [Lepeophtheirus salmonis]